MHETFCAKLDIYKDSCGSYKENNNDNDWYQFISYSKHDKTVISFISVINQLDAQKFCFTVSLFHTSTCFEHMCSKHVEAWNKLIVKQKVCASSRLITEINILRCTVSKMSKSAISCFEWYFYVNYKNLFCKSVVSFFVQFVLKVPLFQISN